MKKIKVGDIVTFNTYEILKINKTTIKYRNKNSIGAVDFNISRKEWEMHYAPSVVILSSKNNYLTSLIK